MSTRPAARFTGWHFTAIMAGFFAVVVGVNVYMANQASSTFGGVVVDNSYVASQHFNRWLDEAAAEDALGWNADVTRRADGRLSLALTGPEKAAVTAVARHPLGGRRDVALRFAPGGPGRWVSHETLPPGRWRLRLDVRADGRLWRAERNVR